MKFPWVKRKRNHKLLHKPNFLFGFYEDYDGKCDLCGNQVSFDLLLVSDLHDLDEDGRSLFLLIAEIKSKEKWFEGKTAKCPHCGNKLLLLHLNIKRINVTEEFELLGKDKDVGKE